MRVLGRVHKGMGPGWLLQTLTKPVPPRRVGGIPVGFPFMENRHMYYEFTSADEYYWTVQYQGQYQGHEIQNASQQHPSKKNPSTQYPITM